MLDFCASFLALNIYHGQHLQVLCLLAALIPGVSRLSSLPKFVASLPYVQSARHLYCADSLTGRTCRDKRCELMF